MTAAPAVSNQPISLTTGWYHQETVTGPGGVQQQAVDDQRQGEPGVEVRAEQGHVRHGPPHLLGKHQLLRNMSTSLIITPELPGGGAISGKAQAGEKVAGTSGMGSLTAQFDHKCQMPLLETAWPQSKLTRPLGRPSCMRTTCRKLNARGAANLVTCHTTLNHITWNLQLANGTSHHMGLQPADGARLSLCCSASK